MNALLFHTQAQALAGALIHFLWQGAVLGAGAALGLRLLRKRSAQARYLFACLFLPLGMVGGCGAKTPLYPYKDWLVGIDSIAGFFGAQLFLWPYLFAILVTVGTLLILITRNPRHFRTLWAIYCIAVVTIVFGIWSFEGKEFRQRADSADWETWLSELWVLGPTVLLIALLLVTYMNCRTWFAAALWVQLALAILATGWFIFVVLLFGDDLLIGGKLSIGTSGVLVLATAWERAHGLHALGVRLPVRKADRCSSLAPAPRSGPTQVVT